MDSVLKQRLVGTLVLVALGIVFWPLIFTQPESRDPLVLGPMPERPEIDRTPIAPPEVPSESVEARLPEVATLSADEQGSADDKTLLDDESAQSGIDQLSQLNRSTAEPLRTAPPSSDPLVDSQGLPRFWVLQVATVSSEVRADALVETLRAREYKAFSSRFLKQGRTLHRVQIGPNAERRRLEKIKLDIDQALSVDSQILRYTQ
jgi:DedD protein